MNLDGEDYFYLRNAQGDIIALCDKNGAEVASYVYDSLGKLVSIDGTLKDSAGVKNPYRYRGYRYDTETGLYYLQSRYYNPDWGRFINADAIIGSLGELLGHNVFAYCKNNVVNGKDPSGFKSMPEWADEDWEYEAPDVIDKILNASGSKAGQFATVITNTITDIGISRKVAKVASYLYKSSATYVGYQKYEYFKNSSKFINVSKNFSKVSAVGVAVCTLSSFIISGVATKTKS